MDEMYHLCMRHVNRRVRVHTCRGEWYDGVIVKVDRDNVYLRTSDGLRLSAWYGYGPRNAILTLSLFTLLAIALI